MAVETVTLPQLGESVLEGVVVEWLVQVGDHVNVDDPLCEIETDKANAEVPSPISGYVAELIAPLEEPIGVGEALLTLSTEKVEGAAPAAPAPKKEEPKKEEPKATSPAPTQNKATAPTPPAPGPQTSAPVSSAPAAGPGAFGALIQNMMTAAPQATAPVAAAPAAAPAAKKGDRWLPFGHPEGANAYRYPQPQVEEGDRVEKFSRRRKMIAEHMVISQSVSPHVVTVAEVDMTNVVNLRNKHKKRLKDQGIGLTFLTFLLKATVEALREYPVMNSVVGDGQLIYKNRINLGCAVETDAGLVVPVLRDADQVTLVGLAQRLARLAKKARDNALEPDDVVGGTFTVTNPGLKGNLYGGAVINQPQVGIVRMGEIKKRPMIMTRDGQDVIAVRHMMYLALSYDHRVIDGVTGNSFLFRIRELMEAANFHV